MTTLDKIKSDLQSAKTILDQQQYSLNQEKYGSSEFKSLENRVKDTRARVAQLQSAYNKAKKPVDAAKNAKTKTTDLKTITDLQTAKQKALAVNPQADVTQLDADIAALQKKQNIVVDGNTQAFDWSKYSVDANGVQGPVVIDGKTQTGQVFMVVTPTSKGNMVTPYGSATEARAAFVKAFYSQPGGIDKLKNDLKNSNYITDAEYNSNNYLAGIDTFLANYAKHQIQDVVTGGQKEETPMMDFLANKSVGLGGSGGGNGKRQVITNRGDAKKQLDAYLTDLIGRPSTLQEEEDYYNQLHKAENSSIETTVNGVTRGQTLPDADRLLIAANVAKKTLKGLDVNEILSSKNGSQVAADITNVQKLASKYGIPMDAVKALSYVRSGLGTKDALVKQEERLRQLSIQLHPYLKDHLLAGGNVKDVADVYANAKLQKLGVAVPDSTADTSVMTAVRQGKTIDQYNQELQADPLWRKSDEAHQSATQFANTILSAFGFGG
jgi:hypothetical protein